MNASIRVNTMTIAAAARIVLVLLATALAVGPANADTKTTQPPLKHMSVDLSNRSALRDGAMYFMGRCMACHSVQGSRFKELVKPLDLNAKQVQKTLNPTGRRVTQTMVSAMPMDIAKKFLSKAAPDLTVIAKRRSVDWLYTYLTSFYLDPSRPTGVNNVVFYNVAMPDVFSGLQGLQAPVMKEGYRFGQKTKVAMGVKPLTKGSMSPQQFDTMAKDLVNFLYLLAHPHAQERHSMGPWILGLLGLLTILSYLLYKAYWKRVIPPQGGRWRQYWKKT